MADNIGSAEPVKSDAPSDAKVAEKKGPLTVYDIPVHLFEKITDKLALADCLSLGKVSNELRRIASSNRVDCKVVKFDLGWNSYAMNLDDLELEYKEAEGGGCEVTAIRNGNKKTKTYQDGRDYKQVMCADALTFLALPKLEIGRIEIIGGCEEEGIEFMQFLKSQNLRLNVKSIECDEMDYLDAIHHLLKPEKLEEILSNSFEYVDFFNEAAETCLDVLKNPKLKIFRLMFNNYNDEKVAKFSEIMRSINTKLNIQFVVVTDKRWIPSLLQFVNHEAVEDVIIRNFADVTVAQFNELARAQQWKTKMRLRGCRLPEEIGLDRLIDFKEVLTHCFNLTEENFIRARETLLRSPHLEKLELKELIVGNEAPENWKENIIQFMSRDPGFNPQTRRLSLPNSRDYFQLKLRTVFREMSLTLTKSTATGTRWDASGTGEWR